MASILILVIVFVLDLIAFGLAVAAEQRRSTAHTVNDGMSSYCKYDSDIATGFGVGAFVLLLASQLLIMLASRCLCCGGAQTRRFPGLGCHALHCLLGAVLHREVCLLAGSVKNAYHTKYRRLINQNLSCQTLRKGVFGAGAAFIVFTGIVSELYYASYSKARADIPSYSGDTGIRMSNIR